MITEETFKKDDNLVKLDVTSKSKQIHGTDISFFQSDTNTAQINFLVLKNGIPFEISDENAKASIVIESEDFNEDSGVYISDELKFEDPLKGKLSYVLPETILHHNGKMIAQVYFVQNGSSNTIVEKEFSFNIERDRLSDFDGNTKLIYIKSIKDIISNLTNDAESIKNKWGKLQEFLDKVKEASNKGLVDIDNKFGTYLPFIDNKIEEQIDDFRTQTNGLLNKINSQKGDLESKLEQIETHINDRDVVKNGVTTNWQKSKITQDNGLLEEQSEITIQSILDNATKTSILHIINALDAPSIKQHDESVLKVTNPTELTEYYDVEENKNDLNGLDISTFKNNTTSQSGILVILKSQYNGRSFWYPDDSNDIYVRYQNHGLWSEWEKINETGITRESIDTLINTSIADVKNYNTDYLNNLEWQKHKMTEVNGNAINVDLEAQNSILTELSAGLYFVDQMPDLPKGIEVASGYLKVTVRNDDFKLFEYTPANDNKVYTRAFNNQVLSDWFIPYISSTDVLFEGAANGVGSEIKLTKDYTKYSFIVVTGKFPGGTFNEITLPSVDGNIIINKANIIDNDGNGGAIYEAQLLKKNNTTLVIDNDVFYDFGTNKGSGAKANRFIIRKIVGWK